VLSTRKPAGKHLPHTPTTNIEDVQLDGLARREIKLRPKCPAVEVARPESDYEWLSSDTDYRASPETGRSVNGSTERRTVINARDPVAIYSARSDSASGVLGFPILPGLVFPCWAYGEVHVSVLNSIYNHAERIDQLNRTRRVLQ